MKQSTKVGRQAVDRKLEWECRILNRRKVGPLIPSSAPRLVPWLWRSRGSQARRGAQRLADNGTEEGGILTTVLSATREAGLERDLVN